MTAPSWILDALMNSDLEESLDRIANELLERLPIVDISNALDLPTKAEALRGVVAALSRNAEVVKLTELYQDACRALDAAGVPYSTLPPGPMVHDAEGYPAAEPLSLAGRIRWLAQQRPTALELQRVTTERDHALFKEKRTAELLATECSLSMNTMREMFTARHERDAAITERDEARAMAKRRTEVDDAIRSMMAAHGVKLDLLDEDLDFLWVNVAGENGFVRPLIAEIRRRRAEQAAAADYQDELKHQMGITGAALNMVKAERDELKRQLAAANNAANTGDDTTKTGARE